MVFEIKRNQLTRHTGGDYIKYVSYNFFLFIRVKFMLHFQRKVRVVIDDEYTESNNLEDVEYYLMDIITVTGGSYFRLVAEGNMLIVPDTAIQSIDDRKINTPSV